jgi:hypothetical protein
MSCQKLGPFRYEQESLQVSGPEKYDLNEYPLNFTNQTAVDCSFERWCTMIVLNPCKKQ